MNGVADRWRTLREAPQRWAEGLRRAGRFPVRTIGERVPRERLAGRGLVAVDVLPQMARETPHADRLVGDASMPRRGRALLEALLGEADPSPLLIVNDDAVAPQLFAALRDLIRDGEAPPFALHFLDLPYGSGAAAARYRDVRLAEFDSWLEQLPVGEPLAAETSRAALAKMDQARAEGRIATADLHAGLIASRLLPPDEFARDGDDLIAASGLIDATGDSVALSGLMPGDWTLVSDVERDACVVTDNLIHAARYGRPERGADEAKDLVAEAALRGARRILHFVARGDERAAWHVPFLRRAAERAKLAVEIVELDERRLPVTASADSAAVPAEPPSRSRGGVRSRKALGSIADFGRYQREWFASVRAEVESGAPFAVVNANAPQELLRAMNVPFVVNQWWASIVAAKQQSSRDFDLLREHGYPADVEAYSSQGLAALFDDDPEEAPWGGLPRPDFLFAVRGSDATPGIYENWAHESGAALTLYERTTDPRMEICEDWWNRLPARWDEEIEASRLDLLEAELRGAVDLIESRTDRRFDEAAFERIMTLVNEQEEWYRRTRDLIASAPSAPVGVVDTMPATMVPQWHRGTEWARDAARTFHDEVAALVDSGASVSPREQVRLMWVGRGLWSNMGFYQQWEESHGAVFVWSMYLALAADGYIREHGRQGSPMRALAARFTTMGDELRMPRWAGAWHVHEARTHRVDGAVALTDADPFVLRALEQEGIPVLTLDLDNYNQEASDAAGIEARMLEFIESFGSAGPVSANAPEGMGTP